MTNLAIALMMSLQLSLPGNVSQDRLRVVSEDMVSVVNEEFEKKNIRSSMTESEALNMLAAATVGESNLRTDIENCKVTGDGGRSVGLGQVMNGPNWKGYSRRQICGNRKIQLKLSLHVLDACWSRSPQPDAVFRCYTTGNPTKQSYAAKTEYSFYKRIKKNVNIAVRSQKIQTCCEHGVSSFYVREKSTCDL